MPYDKRIEFVDFQLTAKQKEEFSVWRTKQEEHFDPVCAFINASYKVTFSWEKQNQCYVCYVFPTKPDDYNQGACLTARSDNWYKAALSAWYKHSVVKKERWWVPKETKPSDMWDF